MFRSALAVGNVGLWSGGIHALETLKVMFRRIECSSFFSAPCLQVLQVAVAMAPVVQVLCDRPPVGVHNPEAVLVSPRNESVVTAVMKKGRRRKSSGPFMTQNAV